MCNFHSPRVAHNESSGWSRCRNYILSFWSRHGILESWCIRLMSLDQDLCHSGHLLMCSSCRKMQLCCCRERGRKLSHVSGRESWESCRNPEELQSFFVPPLTAKRSLLTKEVLMMRTRGNHLVAYRGGEYGPDLSWLLLHNNAKYECLYLLPSVAVELLSYSFFGSPRI